MYKVLLVDDEPWALIALEKVINWQDKGFDNVYEATNSLEALEIIKTEKPDAVFTDIRMPGIDGLALIKNCRQNNIQSEFIVVSGYAEFNYAREALREGAFEYLLKPVNSADLEKLLSKLKQFLDSKRIRDDCKIFENLIENKKDAIDIIDKLGVKFENNRFLCISMIAENIENIDETLSTFGHKAILSLGFNRYVYLMDMNITVIREDIFEKLKDIIKPDQLIGLSEISDNINKMHKILNHAVIAMNDNSVNKNSNINVYKQVQHIFVKKSVNKLVESLKENRFKEPSKVIKEIIDTFVEKKMGIQECVLFYNQVVSYIVQNYDSLYSLTEIEFIDYNYCINNFTDIYSLFNTIEELLLSITGAKLDKSNNINETVINENFKQLLKYVNEHFTEHLLLKELSAKYFINFTYCSELFKNTANLNFSEYITKLRLEKACRLLRETSSSIEQICSEVGYNDYYYFNKVFKKYKGITAAKYRRL
jgi:two-component system response regulator YesN